jgi:hypothetical protein
MNTDNQLYEVVAKLEKRLKDGLSALPFPITLEKVCWINASFTTPNNLPWLRNSIINFGPIDQDASGSYEINQGLYVIGVFWPKKSGIGDPLRQAQAIKSLYTGEFFDDVVIESVTVSPTPEPESSSWYGVNVSITYSFEGATA